MTDKPVTTPEGWKLVPIKCTEAMIEAALKEEGTSCVITAWNAMLKASPAHHNEVRGILK